MLYSPRPSHTSLIVSLLPLSLPFFVHLALHPYLFSQDVALVRMYRELSRRIVKDAESSPLKCKVVPWGGAWEVEKWLLEN